MNMPSKGMLRLHTLNSQYEVNLESKKIRRLSGQAAPTSRMGNDSEWKSYTALIPLRDKHSAPEGMVPGNCILIQWENIKTTLTSPLTKVEEFALPDA